MLRSINFFEHSLPFPPHSQLLAHGFVLVRHLPSSSTLVETSDLETLDLSLKTATGFSASPDASRSSLSLSPSFGLFFFPPLCPSHPMQTVNLPSWLFFSSFDTTISSHTSLLRRVLPFFSLCRSNFPLYLFEPSLLTLPPVSPCLLSPPQRHFTSLSFSYFHSLVYFWFYNSLR